MHDQLLTAPEVARRLRVSLRTIRALIARGEIPVVRVGARVVRVDLRDVEEYILARRERRGA